MQKEVGIRGQVGYFTNLFNPVVTTAESLPSSLAILISSLNLKRTIVFCRDKRSICSVFIAIL